MNVEPTDESQASERSESKLVETAKRRVESLRKKPKAVIDQAASAQRGGGTRQRAAASEQSSAQRGASAGTRQRAAATEQACAEIGEIVQNAAAQLREQHEAAAAKIERELSDRLRDAVAEGELAGGRLVQAALDRLEARAKAEVADGFAELFNDYRAKRTALHVQLGKEFDDEFGRRSTQAQVAFNQVIEQKRNMAAAEIAASFDDQMKISEAVRDEIAQHLSRSAQFNARVEKAEARIAEKIRPYQIIGFSALGISVVSALVSVYLFTAASALRAEHQALAKVRADYEQALTTNLAREATLAEFERRGSAAVSTTLRELEQISGAVQQRVKGDGSPVLTLLPRLMPSERACDKDPNCRIAVDMGFR